MDTSSKASIRDYRSGPVSAWHVGVIRSCVGICVLAAWVGCGGGNPFPMVRVTGTIRYEDGSVIPAAAMRLIFDSQAPPADAVRHPRPATTPVNVADGSFGPPTSYRHGDGLVRGKHRVVIDVTPQANAKLPVPVEYTRPSTTPLIIDTEQVPLEVRVPLPH